MKLILQQVQAAVQTQPVLQQTIALPPNPLTVTPGTTVTWKNTDTAMHVVCSGKPTDDECGKVFEEDSLKPGKTFQLLLQMQAHMITFVLSIHG